MKKELSILIIGIYFISALSASGSTVNSSYYNIEKTPYFDNYSLEISFPSVNELNIINQKDKQIITIEDFKTILVPGMPQIPYKNVLIALPPGASVLYAEFKGINPIKLEHTYNIAPAPIAIPLDNINQNKILRSKEEWNKNYYSVYNKNNEYPTDVGELIGSGAYRKYSYALLTIYPLSFNPKSGEIFYYEYAHIDIKYKLPSSEIISKLKTDTLLDEKAEEIFENYNQIKDFYRTDKSKTSSKSDTYNYVIITTNDLYDTISSSSFIPWKNSIGFNVKIVRTSDSEITSQTGIDLGEKIRNFLREFYIDWGIEFVLIIGDYESIPMRYCYPDPTNHVNSAGTPGGPGGDVPTDYYYADLSSSDADSWDFDGDGYHGEYVQDKPDFLPEVFVGRIPINDESKVSYTLEKTVAFEQDTDDWKKNALHPAAFFYFTDELGAGEPAMDGATCCAYIENDFMNNWTVSRYSEQEGLEKSVYPWNPLSESAFTNDWRTGKYSIVNWGAHGWSDMIARKVWAWDDGNGVPDANEINWPTMLSTSSNLDDDYPSVVTSISCYVGYPEPNNWGNMGIDLLTKPNYGSSIGVISSARTPYGTSDWPNNPGASYSIIYEFNRFLINNSEKVGEAFFNSKHYCNVNFNWYGWVEYNDLYTFNLYGDPSLNINGIDIGEKPDKPSIPDGPTSGKAGEEYTYSSNTTDPNNDQIYYMFDWGDGSDSGWLGPFDSGEECKAAHIWEKKAGYQIKVRAKDTNNLLSEWSEPLEISIPKNHIYSSNTFIKIIEKFQIIMRFFNYITRL